MTEDKKDSPLVQIGAQLLLKHSLQLPLLHIKYVRSPHLMLDRCQKYLTISNAV